jgi:hypothetical protein
MAAQKPGGAKVFARFFQKALLVWRNAWGCRQLCVDAQLTAPLSY